MIHDNILTMTCEPAATLAPRDCKGMLRLTARINYRYLHGCGDADS